MIIITRKFTTRKGGNLFTKLDGLQHWGKPKVVSPQNIIQSNNHNCLLTNKEIPKG
jgi:hypothetical protein